MPEFTTTDSRANGKCRKCGAHVSYPKVLSGRASVLHEAIKAWSKSTEVMPDMSCLDFGTCGLCGGSVGLVDVGPLEIERKKPHCRCGEVEYDAPGIGAPFGGDR